LDTSVIIKAFQKGLNVKNPALDMMTDPRREFVVSDVLKIELFPKPRFHKQAKELDFYERFFRQAVLQIETTPAIMARAIDLASQFNVASCDALHLSVAIEANVDEFITIKKPQKPFFQVTGLNFQMTSIYEAP
jgi:predicted nucleic acid-binding protein